MMFTHFKLHMKEDRGRKLLIGLKRENGDARKMWEAFWF